MTTAENDLGQRFLFDHTDIRGEILSLQDSYQQVLQNGDYPPALQILLGEFLAGVALLSATLKFDGSISLQAIGKGPVNMIVADCTRQSGLRAITRFSAAPFDGERGNTTSAVTDSAALTSLLGSQATLAVTIEPAQGERYQGIVPLERHSLSDCLSDYFHRSEQLPTRICLSADGRRAAGLLLQVLPLSDGTRDSWDEGEEHWRLVNTLVDTLNKQEQLEFGHETLLRRLFYQQKVRVLTTRTFRFSCSCSRARTARALLGFGAHELQVMLEEKTPIEITCQFCLQHYRFNKKDIEKLLNDDPTLH